MNDSLLDMIEQLEKTDADVIEYHFEAQKDDNVYVFTVILKRKGD